MSFSPRSKVKEGLFFILGFPWVAFILICGVFFSVFKYVCNHWGKINVGRAVFCFHDVMGGFKQPTA